MASNARSFGRISMEKRCRMGNSEGNRKRLLVAFCDYEQRTSTYITNKRGGCVQGWGSGIYNMMLLTR